MAQPPDPETPLPPSASPAADPPVTPPRAFSQGVGLVFQLVGVILFLGMMFTCCGSGLLSREWATREELQRTGWQLGSGDPARPAYSVQRATTLAVTCGVFFGVALAGIGLGLQAESVPASVLGVVVTLLGTAFWVVQSVFAVQFLHAWGAIGLAILLAVVFAILAGLAVFAAVEMRRHPPPADVGVLPPGYKIPYSHYHDDPPEVRLERELAERRQRLVVQQKELEMLEEKLRRKMDS